MHTIIPDSLHCKSDASHVPDHLVVMYTFSFSMPPEIDIAFKEPTTTAENRVVADVIKVVFQVIDAVQSTVAIPAGKGRNHFAGERVNEAQNTCKSDEIPERPRESRIRTTVIDPVKIPNGVEVLR